MSENLTLRAIAAVDQLIASMKAEGRSTHDAEQFLAELKNDLRLLTLASTLGRTEFP
jgi:hypothetical protein